MKSFAVLLVLAFASCAGQKPIQRIPFPQSEYDALPKKGTAIVRGQAFLKTIGGDVKKAAGEMVLLNPVTSYSQQWFDVVYWRNGSLTDQDPSYMQYVRTTVADAEGRFTFKEVPAGRYFLTTRIVWGVPTRGGLAYQGGYVAKQITVVDGEMEIILTK